MLRNAVPIIPVYREKLAPICTGCYRVQRDHCTISETQAEMTESFTSAGPCEDAQRVL